MATALVRRYDDWQERAICTGEGASLFYPPVTGERKKAKVMRERRAKNLCNHCPVAAECLDMALRNDERFGIWGGLTDDERQALVAAG